VNFEPHNTWCVLVKKIIRLVGRVGQELCNESRYLFLNSRPNKILFDHLPKCGGASLSNYLQANFPKRKTYSIDSSRLEQSIEEFKDLPEDDRYSFDLVKGHQAIKLLDYVHPDSLRVTVFRDPIERIISHYYYVKRRPGHYLYENVAGANMTLDEYVASGLTGEVCNYYTTRYSGLSICEAERRPDEAVAKAFETIINSYDIVGFLEDYAFFMNEIYCKANLRFRYKNKKMNVTKNRPGLSSLKHSVARGIQDANRLDIELYKYLKEKVDVVMM